MAADGTCNHAPVPTGGSGATEMLAFVLLLAASAALLFSDTGARRGGERAALRAALVQHASQPIIEEGVRGLLEGLAAGGWVDGDTLSVDLGYEGRISR